MIRNDDKSKAIDANNLRISAGDILENKEGIRYMCTKDEKGNFELLNLNTKEKQPLFDFTLDDFTIVIFECKED